jgi:uncharacterized membrane protein
MSLRRLSLLALILVLFAVGAVVPAAASAQSSDYFAQASQPPPEPGGEPQPGTPTEPTEPVTPGEPGVEAPGGLLPRTGLGAGWIALIGVALLLLGIRLRVISRIKEVVRRYVTPKMRLRQSLEELRAAGIEEERRLAEHGPQVEPSTPTARRMADVH